jgi:hypothetical protein
LKRRTNTIASHNKVSCVARSSRAVIAVSETLAGAGTRGHGRGAALATSSASHSLRAEGQLLWLPDKGRR